jgi:hypothetical protein
VSLATTKRDNLNCSCSSWRKNSFMGIFVLPLHHVTQLQSSSTHAPKYATRGEEGSCALADRRSTQLKKMVDQKKIRSKRSFICTYWHIFFCVNSSKCIRDKVQREENNSFKRFRFERTLFFVEKYGYVHQKTFIINQPKINSY